MKPANDTQLGLALDDPPKRWRESVLVSFHTRKQPMSAAEALAGEKKAGRQERVILSWFRLHPGQRYTPSEIRDALFLFGRDENGRGYDWPITSIRRALSNMANPKRWALGPPPLAHHPQDRRPGPLGAKESTWSLRS